MAAGAALISCYGILATVALLSVLGMAVELDSGLWAAAISGAALLANAGTAWNLRRHRRPGPLLLSLLGAGAILYVMLGSYEPRIEAAGFTVLVGAVAWDLYLLYREVCL